MAFVRTERNADATLFVGDLHEDVSEEILWELMLQAGPVVSVHFPKDRFSGDHQNYGFVEFASEEDAEYALRVLNMVSLYGKPIRLSKNSSNKNTRDVGANLYLGNLDAEVDEKLLNDTFGAFGVLISAPKIMRDPDTGESKHFGFLSYDSFEASDRAIQAMNGQYLCNMPIQVTYAFKKDGQGERHGSEAERILAAKNAQQKQTPSLQPHTLFSAGPNQIPSGIAPIAGSAAPVMNSSAGAAPIALPSTIPHHLPAYGGANMMPSGSMYPVPPGMPGQNAIYGMPGAMGGAPPMMPGMPPLPAGLGMPPMMPGMPFPPYGRGRGMPPGMPPSYGGHHPPPHGRGH